MAEVRRPVKQLSTDVARKIAAGEVIDRPCAIVRELMDNAVDSGADSVSVEISGGGIEKIRISDNGSGMTKEDLKNCAHPHCTSKIVDSSDLMNLTTLGFRGEALASIAAVAKLTISSGTSRMTASVLGSNTIETIPVIQNGRGTIVQSENLFENYPARRVFLKRPASETLLCREIFVEKSLPRTDISFRLTVDGTIRHDFPAGTSLSERFVRALELKDSADLFNELSASGTESDGKSKWSFKLVIGEPSVYRNDRKQIFIYVNGRKIQEYSLLQAIEYGCQGFFPNGTHPVAALFIEVEPSLVDFNIHPAKKEVRFKDISCVHHGVSSTVKEFFRSYGIKNSYEEEQKDTQLSFFDIPKTLHTSSVTETESPVQHEKSNFTYLSSSSAPHYSVPSASPSSIMKNYEQNPWKHTFSTEKKFSVTSTYDLAMEALSGTANLKIAENSIPKEEAFENFKDYEEDFKFIGSTLGTFLIAQVKNTLYLIDQHAAHERILFNRLMAGGSEKQQLLIPYKIETDSRESDAYIESVKDTLASIGFCGKSNGKGTWEFTTIPARWTGTQEDFKEALLEEHTPAGEIMYKIAAMTACKAAVKDGTVLDFKTAEKLAFDALQLKDPHCPHGRPVWTTFTKEQLFARVRRT